MARTTDPGVLLALGSGYGPWIDIARGAAAVLTRRAGLRILLHDKQGAPPIPETVRLLGTIARLSPTVDQTVLDRLGGPAVVVSNNGTPHRCPRVGIDEAAVGALAAQHLLGLGLRRFLAVDDGTSFMRERAQAFQRAIRAAGADCAIAAGTGIEARTRLIERTIAAAGAARVGVLAGNDGLAGLLIAHLLEAGIEVPDRVAVLGVDDSLLALLRSPVPLSTVPWPAERIGAEAARLLLDLIDGAPPPRAPLLFAPAVVLARRSTDVVAVRDPRVAAALRHIRANAHRDLAAEEVVRHCRCGRRTLELALRAELASTLQEEIRRAHLDRALELLSTTDLPIAAVAAASGFSSPQRLANVVRARTGRRPGDFRRRDRGIGDRDPP